MRQKLRTKKISEDEIGKTLEVLIRNKLLDDVEFAKMYVRDRNVLRPTGTYLLRLELKKLGIDENIIVETLAEQNEEELAKRALELKSRLQDADFEKKAQFLQRRGFSNSVIFKILKK